jgi:hypothetical protein
MSTPKTYAHNALFRPGPNEDLNACVGDNGGPYDFGSYGEGFFQAGFQIIEAIKNGAWTIDILVYPAVFDFRHGIELYLKHMTILANRILNTRATMQQGHGILRNWSELRTLFSQINNPYFDPLEMDIVQDILDDVIAVDSNGQVFRYPEDNRGGRHLEQISIINIEVLADGMKVLSEVFEKWDSGLVGLLEERQLSTSSI